MATQAVLSRKTVVVQEKSATLIDKDALRKLLKSKPPEPKPLPIVKVRCDRTKGAWLVLEDGKPRRWVKRAILANVKMGVEHVEGRGCGGGYYNGYATGTLLPARKPTSLPKETEPVYFDQHSACFRAGRWSNQSVIKVQWLVLEEGCYGMFVGKMKQEYLP